MRCRQQILRRQVKGSNAMKMLFKQRMFSWFDSYDIYDEYGNTLFVVKGQLSWGHCLRIFDAAGCPVGSVKEKIFTWMPQFELYTGEDDYVGCLSRELTLFRPSYHIDCNGWRIEGSFWEWDYDILAPSRHTVDALCALMVVLAIDAEKCSRYNHT